MACTGRTPVEDVKTISIVIFAVVFVVAAIVALLLLQPVVRVLVPVAVVAATTTATAVAAAAATSLPQDSDKPYQSVSCFDRQAPGIVEPFVTS